MKYCVFWKLYPHIDRSVDMDICMCACMFCLKNEGDWDSKVSTCFDGIWIASRTPKLEANFILGHLPDFISRFQIVGFVSCKQVCTEVIPGYILAVAKHCTLAEEAKDGTRLCQCLRRTESCKLLLMSHSRRGADFSLSQLLCTKMGALFRVVTR